ncbi:MAG TPA: Imm1 family immunity protein [Bryobacteraceae bacterium]
MPFIDKIVADNWKGAKNTNQKYTCRNVGDAIEAIERLNGRNFTQVVLKGKDAALIVGGGNGGRYSVELALGEDKDFYTLVNPKTTGDQDVTIVTGGQAGAFPANQCVSLAFVLKAVEDFFVHGQPSSALTWEHH